MASNLDPRSRVGMFVRSLGLNLCGPQIETTSANLAIDNLAFAPLFVTAKGAKQLPALYKDGSHVAWQVDEYCEIPFEPSAFGDPEANRVTLCFTPSEKLCTQIAQLDQWCVDAVIANPSLLGIPLS